MPTIESRNFSAFAKQVPARQQRLLGDARKKTRGTAPLQVSRNHRRNEAYEEGDTQHDAPLAASRGARQLQAPHAFAGARTSRSAHVVVSTMKMGGPGGSAPPIRHEDCPIARAP